MFTVEKQNIIFNIYFYFKNNNEIFNFIILLLSLLMLIFLIIFKEFENLSVEKMTLSTALGFEPRSFDCRFQTQLINF